MSIGQLKRGGLSFFVFLLVAASAAQEAEPVTVEQLRAAMKQGQYAAAEQQARDLLQHIEADLGADSIEAATVLDALVEACWRGGKARDPETSALA
ncbi:MAG: hypothetical protein JSV80_17405, partial [Acidobacteriota bacterium]